VAEDREAHARETFRRMLEEFLVLDAGRVGSVTVHFSGGRVRKVEWRAFDRPPEQWVTTEP
jgi:hypothetical protein